jgi:hypothetical protein
MSRDTDRTRRLLFKAGLGAAAASGFGPLGRAALAQGAAFEQPFANGKRQLVPFPEMRPLILLTNRPPQL